jgi:signal transduction histidine kinase
VPINYSTDFSAENSTVLIDNDGLRQVFLNCILNAIDAIEEQTSITKGEIVLETVNELDDTINISISDNGIGLAEEHFDTVFDPFFTTKEVGKGTGLGLAVTHNMIKSAGGSLHFSSSEGLGSTITITLPTTIKSNKTL